MEATARKMTVDLTMADVNVRQDAFRAAMRQLASGVSIVAAGHGERRAGIVATSVSSFSMEPPILLLCVARNSSLAPALRHFGHFSANFVRASQADLATRFSGRNGIERSQRFNAGNWTTLVTGAPVLIDALASIDCDIEEIIDRHTHLIVLGRVAAVRADGSDDALGRWRGHYVSIRADAKRGGDR